jgi:drug/metabolite transporter (DMT)-like permease
MISSEHPNETMTKADISKMVFVAFLWAVCFPMIRIGLASGTSPILFGALRSLIAAIVLYAVARARKEPIIRVKEHWFLLSVIGALAFFAYVGMILGGASVNPGLASVIGNSHPIMASVLAVVFLSESLSNIKIAGLALGFIGVALTSIPSFLGETTNSLLGIGFVLLGALGTGAGNVFLKKVSSSDFPIMALVAQFVIAALLLLPVSIFFEGLPSIKWDLGFSVSLIVLSVGATALADILWLDLLKRNSLSKLNVFIFLTPAFALFMGVVFFHESFGLWEILGIAAILAGVFLILEKKSSNLQASAELAERQNTIPYAKN